MSPRYNRYLRPFDPLFRNPHLATIAGNFWSRPDSSTQHPVTAAYYSTEPGVEILVHSQQPAAPRGDLILVHGLEGSSDAGYARSMAYAALERGWAVHRFNMRSCGGTENRTTTNYHAGQTSDLLYVARELKQPDRPLAVTGYSLGGNVTLKLAGELGASHAHNPLLDAICAVSTPIDLAACAAALAKPSNFIYQRRFLSRLKERVRRRHQTDPEHYPLEPLDQVQTIEDFDNLYTARLFGFGTAANYFRTQSAQNFLADIRVPGLLVQSKDDPLIPYSVYRHPAIEQNPNLELIATEHGGHLGFLSREKPRFWLDGVVLDWLEAKLTPTPTTGEELANQI